jgi:hypothetical protein
MPEYILKALTCFQHPVPNKPQHQPYPQVKPHYGAMEQFAKEEDKSPPLEKAGKKKSYRRSAEYFFFLHVELTEAYSIPSAH